MSFEDLSLAVNKIAPGAIKDIRQAGLIEFPHISTGSFITDYVSSIGGIPRGRITELHGLQASGKTTTALMTAVECQELGLGVLFLDYENSIDPHYAETLGVNLDPKLWAYSQPDTMESGFRIAEHYMSKGSGLVGMVLVDSVSAMATIQDKAHEAGETQVGTQAQVMSVALRQNKKLINDSNTAFVFINQLRSVIDLSFVGQLKAKSGPQYETSGGRALKFYADLRLEFTPTGQETEEQAVLFGGDPKTGKGKVVVGQNARVRCVKNKCGVPWRSAEIYIKHGHGIDNVSPCIDLAIKFGIIKVKGGYFSIPIPYCDDDKLEQTIQGRANIEVYFEQAETKLNQLFQVVNSRLNKGE